jgi:phosphonate transport system substrate-binding protein
MNPLKTLTSLVLAGSIVLGAPALAAIAQDATPAASPAAVEREYDRTDWPDQLNCGLFGGDDAEGALADGAPLADYLAGYLDMPVEYTMGTSYNAVIESMRAGHTNCGTVGPFSYILAVNEAGAEAIAVEVYPGSDEEPVTYDPETIPAYFSVISVKKGRGIAKVEDLPGHSFSFVDPASTSGHLMPRHVMLAHGVNSDEDLESIFAGSHPSSAIALWNDKVDAAATTESTLYNLAAEGQIDLCGFEDGKKGVPRTQDEIDAVYNACPDGSIVVIAYSEPIPNTPFAVSKDLPESLKQAIYDALMDVKDDPELVAAIGYWFTDPYEGENRGFAYIDHYYDPLREIAKELGLDLKSFGE